MSYGVSKLPMKPNKPCSSCLWMHQICGRVTVQTSSDCREYDHGSVRLRDVWPCGLATFLIVGCNPGNHSELQILWCITCSPRKDATWGVSNFQVHWDAIICVTAPCKLISHASPQKHRERERERSIFATTTNYCRDIWYEHSKIAYSYPTLPIQINARLSNIHIHQNNYVWIVFMVCFYTRHTCIDITIYLYTYLYFLTHTYRYDIHVYNHICFDIISIYLSIYLPTYLSIYLSNCLSIYLSIYSLVTNMTNYGTSPLLVGKTTINWQFSMAMLVYRRVYPINIPLNHYKVPLKICIYILYLYRQIMTTSLRPHWNHD